MKNKIAMVSAALLPLLAHATEPVPAANEFLPRMAPPPMAMAMPPTGCPLPVQEDIRYLADSAIVRVTIDEQESDKTVRIISQTPFKVIKDGMTHPVVWPNTGVTRFVVATAPVLRDRSPGFEKTRHPVCSFGQAHLFAKPAADGKITVTLKLRDRVVAGIVPAIDQPSGASAELPVYTEENLDKTFVLAVGDKATVKWHAPETRLLRHAIIERLR